MKKLFHVLALFLTVAVFGQKISDYQFILIPEKFNDVKANKYGLKDQLSKTLKDKKYTIVQESSANNRCNVVRVEVTDTGNMFANKVKVEFKDCNDKSIGVFEGRSNLKDFEPGMQDALQVATRTISNSNPKELAMEDKMQPNAESQLGNGTQTFNKNLTDVISKEGENSSQNLEIYTNGIVVLNKIYLSKGGFVLTNSNNSVPYALFKPSTREDVFRVQLTDGTTTLGYFENGKIVVEIANADGGFRKEIFSKK